MCPYQVSVQAEGKGEEQSDIFDSLIQCLTVHSWMCSCNVATIITLINNKQNSCLYAFCLFFKTYFQLMEAGVSLGKLDYYDSN